MDMATKSHKIIVRITENQLRFLTDVLVKEQRTKSQIIREALNQYLIEKSNRYEISDVDKKK